MIWTLAAKDLRLLLGDRRALAVLLAMPVLFILVLGIALGDERLRVSVVVRDRGDYGAAGGYPHRPWSQVFIRDLEQTAGIQVEVLELGAARRLVKSRKRAAILVFGPGFSDRVSNCSFLAEGVNPFDRDGVDLARLDAVLLRDETQGTAAAVVDQVAQGTLLRVVLPWMIGRAFEKIGDREFIDRLGERVDVPMPFGLGKRRLDTLLTSEGQKQAVGAGVQKSLAGLYPKYNLTGKTWADLTRNAPRAGAGLRPADPGLLRRGDLRYQNLVPSYTVMFAFFLVLTVGWLFVAERRQGTLKRLHAAPISPTQILAGKTIPCLAVSVGQGLFLLGAGKFAFGMSWGAHPLWLLPVVLATSLAAAGMALLVATLARTEAQVAVYGTLLVVVLAGASGCLMGDPELMPERMRAVSRVTPHAWALDAYSQLLLSADPNLNLVTRACAALAAFGVAFAVTAWALSRRE